MERIKMEGNCADCVYVYRKALSSGMAYNQGAMVCRRYPPQRTKEASLFPEVYGSDACGEFKSALHATDGGRDTPSRIGPDASDAPPVKR